MVLLDVAGSHLVAGDVLDTAPAGDRNTGIARRGECVFVTACDQGGSALRTYRLEGDRLLPQEPPPIVLDVDHRSAPAVLGDHVMMGAHRLAAASPEGTLCVYDVSAGRIEVIDALPGLAAALTADGDVWAAASLDGSIVVGWP